MLEILDLMMRISALKQTARTGWNIKFPPGHAFQSRTIPDAESVADHSWSLAMFAFMVGTKLGLNIEKLVTMALVHDIAECVTTDIVTATMGDEERKRVKIEKRQTEDAVMREIFLPHGKFGERCYALWLEYEDGTSEEARILGQLDKLECAMQAVLYQEQGHISRPPEFLAFTRKHVQHPELLEILAALDARA